MVQFSSHRDGSTISGMQLLDGFKSTGWKTHVFFGHEGPMVEQYAARGHITDICPHKNWLRQPMPWQFLRNLLQARRDGHAMVGRMQSVAPTLVYVNSGASYAGAWAAMHLGIPSIWHVRELMADEGGELYAPWGLGRAIRRCFSLMTQARIANSHHVANAMFGPHPDVEVIHNAVDDSYLQLPLERHAARLQLGIPISSTTIGIPGTLRPVKGHAFAMRALAHWLLGDDKRRMLISGNIDSPHARAMQELAATLGIKDRVDFLGTFSDMRLFYDACDLALVPSASETFGRVAIETMARQVPLICTRTGGLREVVQDGRNGLVVDYGDELALLAAVKKLISDKVLSQRLVMHGLAYVKDRFTSAKYQSQVLKVVAKVLNRTNPRPTT